MESLWHQIPRVQAERALAGAQAALYPHLRADHARRWWQATMRLTQQVARGAVAGVKSLFFLNGKALGPQQMRQQLGQQLGGGFERDEGATASRSLEPVRMR